MRPKRRSLLTVPALQERFYSRALDGDADTITFDLEDSVAANAKIEARERLRAMFPQNYHGTKELSIRINHRLSPFYADDIALLSELQPAAVVLPKVERAEDIHAVVPYLADSAVVLVYIESLAGYLNVREILGAPRIAAVLLGAEDLTSELGIERTDVQTQPLLNHIQIELALLARSLGIQSIGPVHRGYGSAEHLAALKHETVYLKQLTVSGRVAIHPTQIPIINEVFGISREEIERAKTVIGLFAEVARSGSAVIRQHQQMEDLPSLNRAEEVLRLAREYGYE